MKISSKNHYPLVDAVPFDLKKKIVDQLEIPRKDRNGELPLLGNQVWGKVSKNIKAMFTGEIRAPKQGEWYLNGNSVGAYQAGHDLLTSYPIARLVHAEPVTVHNITPILA